VGLDDLAQTSHTLRRNFPVLGNLRYLLESVRPEIRQYFIEGDSEAAPFDRAHRALAYQRAKDSPDTIPFGTKRDVYSANYEVGSRGTRKRLSLLCPRCVSLPTASSLALPNCLSRSRSCVLRCSLRPTRCGPRTPRATPPRAASSWAGPTASSRTPPTSSTYRN
jgi:hypothetical protein